MNKYGMLYHKINDRVINGETYKTCLWKFEAKCNDFCISTSVFILDNAKIYYYSENSETINNVGLELVCSLISYFLIK
ncbi:hypothetical protein A0H76_2415 [Hepatospora eriocheir]|uniref:Uncharacterized protein n=1 Tax=Hepatospora eriocheir TaxID=1081669 RepID=A0A1X0QFH8_9MICR|nr:hypothetical protein A0H76_2415 [Hepatospora eriocheir]